MRPRRCTGEAGLTLVELLVTVAIMGIAFAVLVGGLGTAVLGSDLHRKQAEVENMLRSFAESVKGGPYVPCAGPSSYSYATPDGYRATATVEFAPPPFNAYLDDCHKRLEEPSEASTSTFSNPTNAFVIGEAPTPLTADATLQVATAGTATITLRGYGSVPATATDEFLRIVHHEGPGVAGPTVTVKNGTTTVVTRTFPAWTDGLHEERLALAPGAAVTEVTYDVSLAPAAATGSDSLDGIWLQYTDGGAGDPGLQRVSLKVEVRGRPVSQELEVVVRRRES